jgi:hypothetical protein
MHAVALLASTFLLIATFASPAFAQAKKGPSPSAAPTVRYFQFSSDLLGDTPIDAFLKEVRQGARVVAALLDVCYAIPDADPRKDRFAVNLKVEGDKLTGSGQSQEEKAPVTVNLTRKQIGTTFSFTGFITQGQTRNEVNSLDNTDMSEDEFRDNQPAEELIVAAPADFTEVSPGSVAIRVKRDSLIGVVNELKSQKAAVEFDGLTTGCPTLRSGEHVVRAEIELERAAALVGKLKTLPGVVNVGWTNGDYTIDSAVRIEQALWRGADGKLDRAKLASSLADSVAGALAAKVEAATWNAASGELSLKLVRGNQAAPQLDLTDVFEFVAAVGPEKPGGNGALVVWLKYNSVETVDRGPEPRLTLMPTSSDRDGLSVDLDEIMRALARDLNGQFWNPGSGAWQ